MSVSAILIKIVGIILILAGLALILGAIGITFFPASFINPLVSIILGVVLIGFGIYIIKGGTPTL